ncbi:MAG: hypothetical protein IT562_16445 [Alphaproteobacteria bacterium]|nr:hypothetical protein [Alphaproteobacteria bacterium]
MAKRARDSAGGEARKAATGNAEAKQPSRVSKQADKTSTAFDLWLKRELRDMFSDVAQEPVPDELLQLIDEKKAKDGK